VQLGISAVDGIFSRLSGMHGHTLIKHIMVTSYEAHIKLMTFQGHAFRGEGHRQHFENALLSVDIQIHGSSSFSSLKTLCNKRTCYTRKVRRFCGL